MSFLQFLPMGRVTQGGLPSPEHSGVLSVPSGISPREMLDTEIPSSSLSNALWEMGDEEYTSWLFTEMCTIDLCCF